MCHLHTRPSMRHVTRHKLTREWKSRASYEEERRGVSHLHTRPSMRLARCNTGPWCPFNTPSQRATGIGMDAGVGVEVEMVARVWERARVGEEEWEVVGVVADEDFFDWTTLLRWVPWAVSDCLRSLCVAVWGVAWGVAWGAVGVCEWQGSTIHIRSVLSLPAVIRRPSVSCTTDFTQLRWPDRLDTIRWDMVAVDRRGSDTVIRGLVGGGVGWGCELF